MAKIKWTCRKRPISKGDAGIHIALSTNKTGRNWGMKAWKQTGFLIGQMILSLIFFHGEVFCRTPLQYLSPKPGALLVSPETNVIIRPGEPLDRSSVNNSSLITVVGSTSGPHSGTVKLSDDERTIVFNPQDRFTEGETITVTLHDGLRTATGNPVDPLEFTFVVSPKKVFIDPMYSLLSELEGSHQVQAEMKALPPSQKTRESVSNASTGDSLPSDFPSRTILVSNDPSPGKIFLSNFDLTNTSVPYLMILDNTGKPIFYRKMNGNCLDFKVQPNGTLTYWDGSLSYFIALDSAYQVVDNYQCGNGYSTDLHELRVLPNGHALVLSYDPETVDMSQVIPGGDPSATVIGLIIQELDREKNVVFQWRSWDHFQITDATHEDLLASSIDYVHGNALELDNDGNILLSCRHMDEVTKINRQTGEIMWRLGGKNNQFTFINDPIGFSHQHAIRRLPNGNVTLFDNGNFHTPEYSRALEYQLDEQNKTVTLVWQFRNTPDNYGYAMGNIQRLDSGNTLIGWGTSNPTVTEVRPDGPKAFELILPVRNYSYRAFRFPWKENAPLVHGATVVGGEIPDHFALQQNYPNPFNPSTTIQYQIPNDAVVDIRVYNLLGQEVRSLVKGFQSAGYYRVVFDASTLPSGVYFYRLNARSVSGGKVGVFQETKKLVLLK